MSEQHTVLSKVPNSLGFARMAFGAKQIGDLLTTEPQDRSWSDAGVTAVMALTDKADGSWSRAFGSTKSGPFIDRAADVIFCVGGEVALAINGEISAIHPAVSVVRETVIEELRRSAVANGQPPISVGRRGRQKTTAKMSMLTAARSPLSQNPDILESMASVGTALTLLSGAQYGQQYLAGRKDRRASSTEETSTARNGEFRKATASPNTLAARWIHENLPNVTPTHLTQAGELLVEASALLVLVKPKWGVALAIGPYTLGGLIDGIDGNLARLKGMNDLQGMLKDVRADKRQEIFTSAINSLLASKKGNSVAASHYAVGAMTASLPALFRAAAEAKGHIVNEDASGSRVIRGIEGGVGLGLNSSPGAENTVSALMAAGNVITASQRADVALRGLASPHHRGHNDDPEFKTQAAARRNALVRMALGGAVVGAALLAKEHASKLRG